MAQQITPRRRGHEASNNRKQGLLSGGSFISFVGGHDKRQL